MVKSIGIFAGLAVIGTSALAQVRPENCKPVFPLNEPVADLVADRAVPPQDRGFLGLPIFPALVPLVGLIGLVGDEDDDDNIDFVSPA